MMQSIQLALLKAIILIIWLTDDFIKTKDDKNLKKIDVNESCSIGLYGLVFALK